MPSLASPRQTHPSAPLCDTPPAEWVLVDSALHAYSMISVPLYDTLGPDAVDYICNHAELTGVACSAAVAPVLLQALPNCPSLRLLVSAPQAAEGRWVSLRALAGLRVLRLQP